MPNIPRQLKSIIPIHKIIQVEDWWNKLNKENQAELKSIYEEELKSEGKFISIYLCGKFVEQEIPNNRDTFWVNHLYDYIVNHELIIDETMPHIGGICSANKVAEEVIRRGIIPIDFQCPESGEDCQMLKILNLKGRKKSLQFYLKFKLD